MENYYEKYIKYKNKYLKMKESLKNNITGGELLLNIYKDDLVAADRLNDDYYLLDYHGSTDSNSYFRIPDNIILIVSNCCGAFNFGKKNIYVNPLDSSSCPMITKEALIDSISDGKIRLGSNTYFVVKPGTEMCNINLTLKDNDDICSGYFKKNFNQDILSYEVKNTLIKTKFIGLLDYVKNKSTALEFIKNYKPNKILSECIIKSKIYLFLLTKFHEHLPVNEEFKLVDVDDIREKLINFLREIDLMIDNETYDSELSSFTIYEGDFEFIKTRFNEFNNDNFLFGLFNKIIYAEFINQEPTEIKLSEHLYKINSETPSDKKSFVFLYSCQANSTTCSLDHCYRMITFKKSVRESTFNKIKPFMDQSIKVIDINSFIVTVNMSFHIKLNMIDKVFSKFGFINNSKVLYYLICMMYDFINNADVCYEYGIVLSNLVNSRCDWVRRDTIKNIYDYKNWKFLINAILINANYTKSFLIIFEEFIRIFIYYIPNIYELNLEEFLDSFYGKIDIFHNNLLEFVENKTYEIPKSLINEKNIEEFFNNLRLLEDQINGLNYENLLHVLDEGMINYFDFYVKANSGHKAKLNYVNINEVFISDELINVKKIILNELIYIDNRLDVLKNKIKVDVEEKLELEVFNDAW